MKDTAERKELAARVEARLIVLRAFYKALDGNTVFSCTLDDLQPHISEITPSQLGNALDYLEGEGLIEHQTEDYYALTHTGVREYEDTLQAPERDTEHFPASVSIHVHGNLGAVVSGSGNTANFQQVGRQIFVGSPEVDRKLDELSAAIDRLGDEERAQASGALHRVRTELAKKTHDGFEKASVTLKYLETFAKIAALAKAAWLLIYGGH